jgi:hypothetical protein
MRTRHLMVGCLITLCAVCAVIMIPAGVISYQFAKAKAEFLNRHHEAREYIEARYRGYLKNGSWSITKDQRAETLPSLPDDWEHEENPALGGPAIWLHGPLHMMLVYRFEVPKNDSISRQWIFSVEENRSRFDADVAYQP